MSTQPLSFDQVLTEWRSLEASLEGSFNRAEKRQALSSLCSKVVANLSSLGQNPRYEEMRRIASRVDNILNGSRQGNLVARLKGMIPLAAGALVNYGAYALAGPWGACALGSAAAAATFSTPSTVSPPSSARPDFNQISTQWLNLGESITADFSNREEKRQQFRELYSQVITHIAVLRTHPDYGQLYSIICSIQQTLKPSCQERLFARLKGAAPLVAGALVNYGAYSLVGGWGACALGVAAIWNYNRRIDASLSPARAAPSVPSAPLAAPTAPVRPSPPTVTPTVTATPPVTPTLPAFMGIANTTGDNCWANALMQLINTDDSLLRYLMGSRCPASLRGIQQFLQTYDRDLREGRSVCSASSTTVRETLSPLVNGIRQLGGHECAHEALYAIMTSIPHYRASQIISRRAYQLQGAPAPDPDRLTTVCPEYALGRMDQQSDWGNVSLYLPSDEENRVEGTLVRLNAQELIQNSFFTRAGAGEYATYPTLSGGERYNYRALGEVRAFSIPPEYLYVTSLRFDGSLMKKNSPIEFPLEPFELPGRNFIASSPRPRYRLQAVVVHSGTTQGGHYVCYARKNDKWYLLNDSSVQEVQDMREPSSQGYIYLLRRC